MGLGAFTWGIIELESVRIGHPHEHGSTGGFKSTHSGDGIQKVAYSVTQSAGFVWTRGRSDNISFRIQAIQVPCGRALHFMCGKCKLTSKLISSPGVPVVLCMSAYIYFLYLP